MWHLSKNNIQYITTITVKFQTFKSIYQTEEYKSWSSLVPCIPQELNVGVSSQCDHFSYVQYTLFIQCDVIINTRSISCDSINSWWFFRRFWLDKEIMGGKAFCYRFTLYIIQTISHACFHQLLINIPLLYVFCVACSFSTKGSLTTKYRGGLFKCTAVCHR